MLHSSAMALDDRSLPQPYANVGCSPEPKLGDVAAGSLHRQCLEIALAAIQGLQPLLIDLAQAGQSAADAVQRLQAVLLVAAGLCAPVLPADALRQPGILSPSSG